MQSDIKCGPGAHTQPDTFLQRKGSTYQTKFFSFSKYARSIMPRPYCCPGTLKSIMGSLGYNRIQHAPYFCYICPSFCNTWESSWCLFLSPKLRYDCPSNPSNPKLRCPSNHHLFFQMSDVQVIDTFFSRWTRKSRCGESGQNHRPTEHRKRLDVSASKIHSGKLHFSSKHDKFMHFRSIKWQICASKIHSGKSHFSSLTNHRNRCNIALAETWQICAFKKCI